MCSVDLMVRITRSGLSGTFEVPAHLILLLNIHGLDAHLPMWYPTQTTYKPPAAFIPKSFAKRL